MDIGASGRFALACAFNVSLRLDVNRLRRCAAIGPGKRRLIALRLTADFSRLLFARRFSGGGRDLICRLSRLQPGFETLQLFLFLDYLRARLFVEHFMTLENQNFP